MKPHTTHYHQSCECFSSFMLHAYEEFVGESSKKDFGGWVHKMDALESPAIPECSPLRDHLSSSVEILIDRASRDLMIEAAEIGDAVKKGKMRSDILEEVGDLLWYATLMILMCGGSVEKVLEANMEKLRKRMKK